MKKEKTREIEENFGEFKVLPMGSLVPFDTSLQHGNIQVLKTDVETAGMLLEPITVVPTKKGTYDVVNGIRRLRALKQIGLSKVPAYIVGTEDMSQKERQKLALNANLSQRKFVSNNTLELAVVITADFEERGEDFSHRSVELAKRCQISSRMAKEYLNLVDYAPQFLLDRCVRDPKFALSYANAVTEGYFGKPRQQRALMNFYNTPEHKALGNKKKVEDQIRKGLVRFDREGNPIFDAKTLAKTSAGETKMMLESLKNGPRIDKEDADSLCVAFKAMMNAQGISLEAFLLA